MGFFDKKVCAVCGKEAWNVLTLGNGIMCYECSQEIKDKVPIKQLGFLDCSLFFNLYLALIKHKTMEGCIFAQQICFNDQEKKCYILSDNLQEGVIETNYSDIIEFDLLEDGASVSSGGLGRAVVGGLLLGGVGAIVGGITGSKKAKNICNKLVLKLTVKNHPTPTIFINFVIKEIKTKSKEYEYAYNQAQQCLSKLQLICNERDAGGLSTISVADELLKFKQLLDMGVITQEEFDNKKHELLGK